MRVTLTLSRSLKVKIGGVIGLAIYGFLSMDNSNNGAYLGPFMRYKALKFE